MVVEDYLGDTSGLTLAEHGAYMLSMMLYVRKCEALTVHEMRRLCGGQYNRVVKFYVAHGDFWHHKRIDTDLAEDRRKSRMFKIKSQKMVEARQRLRQKRERNGHDSLNSKLHNSQGLQAAIPVDGGRL